MGVGDSDLDPLDADALTALAVIDPGFGWAWEDAARRYLRALELHPGSSAAPQWYQNLLRVLGQCDEAAYHGAWAEKLSSLVIAGRIVGEIHTSQHCDHGPQGMPMVEEEGRMETPGR